MEFNDEEVLLLIKNEHDLTRDIDLDTGDETEEEQSYLASTITSKRTMPTGGKTVMRRP